MGCEDKRPKCAGQIEERETTRRRGWRVEKLKGSMVLRPKMKIWMIRALTSILIWTCLVQLTTLGEMWRPRCFEKLAFWFYTQIFFGFA